VGELLRIALRAILSNKMRSFLTVLGIIIGVLAVVAVVSIMQGVFQSFLGQFEALGGDTLFIQINYRLYQDHQEAVKRLKLTYADAQALAQDVPQVKEICPVLTRQDTISFHSRHDTTQVWGTSDSFASMNSLAPKYGRFLAPMDMAARRKVCVIGHGILDKLALSDGCVGQEIRIGNGTYEIVGVLQKKGGSIFGNQDDAVFIPLSTAILQYGQEAADSLFIQVQVRDAKFMEAAIERISAVLRRQHGLRFGQQDDFMTTTQDEILKEIKEFSSISTLVVGAIVGITLIVGGIGIMNIMLVSVTERTREIGIRMAVGAKRVHILYQFLIESVTLSTLGGILGLILGWGVAHLTVTILHHTVAESFPPAYVPLWVIFLSLFFAAFTGAVFGVYPAFKASRLDPIDALRYE
jgi:putative ABC transport system permease protein